MPLRGQLLVARPELTDPNFVRTVVSILAHDDDGAMGVVLNRVADAVVGAELPVDVDLDSLVLDDRLYVGGPVEPEALIVVGENADGSAAVWSGDPGPRIRSCPAGLAPISGTPAGVPDSSRSRSPRGRGSCVDRHRVIT